LNVSTGMALYLTHRGLALRDRLPRVAALFESGLISDLLVRTIVWRTYLIEDPDAMANVDAALAEQVVTWGPLSAKKTEQAIDALVERFDPGALRRIRDSSQHRDVTFGSPSGEAGCTSMWARLLTGDAKVLEQKVNQIAGRDVVHRSAGIRHRWRNSAHLAACRDTRTGYLAPSSSSRGRRFT
jgi:hypothetical protein